ncbi:hypothetical protein K456DRAFT_1718828 [Colletotrichum gloeosporioides 23]|nr:hypothetical protein K456DRAFT_1718828 [Colletotrichum gloeosporioides 23]
MRASTIFVTLFAALTVAMPLLGTKNELSAVNEASLLVARQGAPAGTCSKGGDKGESCAALKCQSNSKSGRGNGVCCCN